MNLNKLPVVDKLTPREAEVWALHRQGLKRGEIAQKVSLKPDTVTRMLCTVKEKVYLH